MSTMRRVLAAGVVAVVLGVPGELAAQRLAVWVMPSSEGERLQNGAFAMLLNSAAEVGLTEDQLDDIDRIRERLAERTERHVAQIRDAEVWGVEAGDTAAAAGLARVRQEVADFTSEAEVEVDALLTPEQRVKVAEVLKGAPLAGATPAGMETAEGAAAAAAAPVDSATAAAEAARLRTTVTVDNQNYLDMSVYVYRGGQRYRLGSLSGLNTRTFVLPEHLLFGLTTLRFQVDPVARPNSPLSDEVMVRPGDEIVLRIPPT